MSDTKRQLRNVGKLAGMGIFGIVAVIVLAAVLVWPMVLWAVFGQPLSVAVVITITWIAAII